MTRKPRRCRPAGTEPPALFGSRDAPTTAIVFAFCRTSCELRATVNPSYPTDRLFRTFGVKRAIGKRNPARLASDVRDEAATQDRGQAASVFDLTVDAGSSACC